MTERHDKDNRSFDGEMVPRDPVGRIDGVGPSKAQKLRNAGYETVGDVHRASKAELENVNGIGSAMAARMLVDVADIPESDDLEAALWESLAALEDLRAQLAGGAVRSGVSKAEVWERVADAYDLDAARGALEESGYTRDGDAPRDFAVDELVAASRASDSPGGSDA